MDKKKILVIVAAVLIVLIGAAAVFAAPVNDAYFSKRSVKNIKFLGENAGAMEKNEITALVKAESEKENPVKINVKGEIITIDASDAGVKMDIDKTVEKIMSSGKKNLGETMKLRKGAEITPVYSSDKKLLRDVIEAQLSEKGMNISSYTVDINDSTADFVILTENIPVDYDNLYDKIVEVCEKNEKNAEIKANFGKFIWPTADELRDDFDVEMQNASMSKENGEVKYQSHIVGRKIDYEALESALNEKKTEFSVSYKKENPKVYTDDLGDEGFPDLLGKYTTYYSEGQWGRSVNVKLAASKINGYIMNTGDVFSFNGVVGKRSYANGFKDATVYSGNGVEEGVGGGICQVSSTLYAAVLYADMDIVTRTNHSYVVAYMPAGLDATVSYGTIDFKFKNDKKNPVKIKATASGGVMTVRIYGTKENNNTVVLDSRTLGYTPRGERKVYDSSLPLGATKVEHSGYDGAKAQVYKYIKAPDGSTISTENLGISTYIPLNKVVRYNDGIDPDNEAVKADLPKIPQVPENASEGETVPPEVTPPPVEQPSETVVPDIQEKPVKEEVVPPSVDGEEGQASSSEASSEAEEVFSQFEEGSTEIVE